MIPYCLVKVRKAKTYVAFNPVLEKDRAIDFLGYRILEHCDGRHHQEELADIIAGDMQWDKAAARTAVTTFLNDLTREGIIAWREYPSFKQKLPAPRQVFWDITARCNLRCLHCYNSDGAPHDRELSNAEVERTLEEIHRSGVEKIIFTGGEPFLRPGFTELVVFTAHLGFTHVSVATNGTLLDHAMVAQLRHPNVHIQVSLDGDTAELHDRLRGQQGCFDQALRSLKILQEAGVQVKVCTTLSNLNFRRLPNIIELMNDLGIENYRFQGIVPSGRGKLNAREIILSNQRWKSLVADLVSRNLDPGSLSYTLQPPPDDPVDWNASGVCSAGYSTCTITSDGTVVPCTYFWGTNGDNVREHSFQWIWEHSNLLNYFRNIRLNEIRGACRQCAWFSRCHGGCRAECYLDGDLLGSNRYCWVAEENAQKLPNEP